MVDEVFLSIGTEGPDPADEPEPLEGYHSRRIADLAFLPIPLPAAQGPAGARESAVCYIDGGQTELIRSPSYLFSFFRIKAVMMRQGILVRQLTQTFFALFRSREQVSIFPEQGTTAMPSPPSLDRSLPFEEQPGLLRRIAEISMAQRCLDVLEKEDLVCLDGDLQSQHPQEKERLEKLFDAAQKKGVAVAGLGKTCSLITKKGIPLLQAISGRAGMSSGYVEDALLPEEGKPQIIFARLNRHAKHLFRIDLWTARSCIPEVMGRLSWDAQDAAFPGYPYGLQLADRLARVSEREKTFLTTQLQSLAGKRWTDIEAGINSLNAHDILDSMG